MRLNLHSVGGNESAKSARFNYARRIKQVSGAFLPTLFETMDKLCQKW